jgi:hypothetical protein
MIVLVDKENLEMPEMYPEIMKLDDTITVDIPSTSNEGTAESTIVVDFNVNRIKQTWARKYSISKPTLDLEFEMVKTYKTNVTTEDHQARYREPDELREELVLHNIEERKLRDPSQRDSDDQD